MDEGVVPLRIHRNRTILIYVDGENATAAARPLHLFVCGFTDMPGLALLG